MVANQTDSGFTIVEVVVTLAVMSVFLTLLFQTYITNLSQQKAIIIRSAADDIAVTNLKKITTRNASFFTSNPITCDASDDLLTTPTATGTPITLSSTTDPAAESLTGTDLPPSTTTQTITVLYPQGCNPSGTVPIEILSTVNYNSGTEKVQHATYIN
jgi:prepilin-type N-terminal cleavage/methylation domain-containing protein